MNVISLLGKLAIAAVVIGVGAVIAGKKIKEKDESDTAKKGEIKTKTDDAQVDHKKESEKALQKHDERTQVSETAERAEISGSAVKKVTTRQLLRRNASRLSDLLEPMAMVENGTVAEHSAVSVFNEWDMRISNTDEAESLIKLWKTISNGYEAMDPAKLRNAAARWITQLASCGISRDSRNEVQVTDRVMKAYMPDGQEKLQLGSVMFVKIPAWYLDEEVLRQGILAKEKS